MVIEERARGQEDGGQREETPKNKEEDEEDGAR
jgi:hypothetical protein